MPLPANRTSWPPAVLQPILPYLNVWSAWYAGDEFMLASVYGGAGADGGGAVPDPVASTFFASDTGTWRAKVTRGLRRWFWGETTKAPDRRNKLHVPIAADLCQASADLLFADQVKLAVPEDIADGDGSIQEYLDDLADDGIHTRLAEAAEVAAALGGCYLRISWDDKISDRSMLTRIDADQALPEFKFDLLQAVTFWQVTAIEGDQIWRHLERHELDAQGDGVIIHGLYKGTNDNLGISVPLTDSPVTYGLADSVDENSSISTKSPGLAVEYVPNQRPQRRWRTNPLGKSYGRSDLDGIESLMDALDETYSSWMRDLRLGKSRLLVGKQALEDQGPGNGATFDQDREIFTTLNMPPSAAKDSSTLAQVVQFNIRFAEHKATAQQIIGDILRSAGYAAQTFGETDESGGRGKTATEVESRERRSLLTRDRKIRIWRPAIANVVEKMMAVDQAIFGAKIKPVRPVVNFSDGVQESQLVLAQTALALDQASAASTETLVRMVHPDWDDEQVQNEVDEIKAQAPNVPDPTTFRPPGAELPSQALPQGGKPPTASDPAAPVKPA